MLIIKVLTLDRQGTLVMERWRVSDVGALELLHKKSVNQCCAGAFFFSYLW